MVELAYVSDSSICAAPTIGEQKYTRGTKGHPATLTVRLI